MLLVVAGQLHAQRARDWAPADRVVVGDFSIVRAVASGLDRLYVVGALGIMMNRPLEQRWEGPYSPPDPAILDRVFLAQVDPIDQSLWMLTSNAWLNVQPALQLWSSGSVPGNVRAMAIDEADPAGGIRISTSAGWYRVASGSQVAVPAGPPVRPLRPATVQDALAANPSLRSNVAYTLRDARGRSTTFTSAAPSPDGLGWYLGTSGSGLLFIRPGDATPERQSFGLTGDKVGALYSSPGGVWVATDRTDRIDAAVTYLTSDLVTSTTLAGGATLGLGYTQVRRMTAMNRSLFLATDAGVTQLEVASGRTHFFGAGGSMPDPRTNTVIGRRGTVLVGTARGLSRITDTLTVVRLAPTFLEPVLALETEGDSIWIGTPNGLLLLPPEAKLPGRTPGLAASASLRGAVVALAWLGDTLVALTTDQLLWRMPATDEWTLGPILSSILGRLRVFTLFEDGFFVAGERGLAYAGLRTPPQRPLLGAEHPGLIRDLIVEDGYLWEATDRGLVRWRIDAIMP